LRIAKYNKT